ncbi:MAG: hypothetical protein ACYDEY_02245 [Acidimicrobiales bacterium]
MAMTPASLADRAHDGKARRRVEQVTGGVDTHAYIHVAAAIDQVGREPGWAGFPTSPANPHFFIHYLNAPTIAAVSRTWVNRRLGISAQAIHRDRIVDEAIATGGDVRQISDYFGVTVATPTQYAEDADRHPRLSDGASSYLDT